MTKWLAILLLSNNLMCLKAMQELDQNDTRSNKSFVSQTNTKTTQSLRDAMEKFGNHFKPTYANFSWFQELATFTGWAIEALEKQDFVNFKVFARYLYRHTCAHNDKITEKKEISDKVILNNFANPVLLQLLRQFNEDATLDGEYLEYLKYHNSPSKTVFSNLAANLKTLTQTLGTYRQLPSGESLKPILEKLLKNSQTARIRLKDLQQKKKDEISFIEKGANISMISGASRSYLTNNQANISVRSGLNYSNDNDSQNLSELNLSGHTISAYHSKIERKNSSPAKLLGAIIEEDSAKKVASQKNSPEKLVELETSQFLFSLPILQLHPAYALAVDDEEDINLDCKRVFPLEVGHRICLEDTVVLQTKTKPKPVVSQQDKEPILTETAVKKTDSILLGQGYRNSFLTQTRKEVPISNKSPVMQTESCMPCSIF